MARHLCRRCLEVQEDHCFVHSWFSMSALQWVACDVALIGRPQRQTNVEDFAEHPGFRTGSCLAMGRILVSLVHKSMVIVCHSLIFDIIQMAFQILDNSCPTNILTCGTKSVVLENVLGFTRVLDVVLEHIEKELSQILGSNWYETLNYSVFSGQMQPKTRKETQGTLQHG